MLTPKFFGQVKKGKLNLYDPARYLVHLSSLEGKPVEVIVRKVQNNRTLSQNSWYWGVILEIISDHTGETKEDLHEHFLSKFASRIDYLAGKEGEVEEIRVKERSHTMSTVRFTEYIESIRQWASEFLGLAIPDPGEVEI